MNRRKALLWFFVLTAIILLFYILQFQESGVLESNREFEVRGLTWRTVSYYYPGIYGDLYNSENNFRLIKKAKETGANYLLLRVLYTGTKDGNVIGNSGEAKQHLNEAISQAHGQDIKIFLVPYVESRDYWISKKWALSEKAWSATVLEWARFAEKNNVEMFAPGVEMNLVMGEDKAGEWLKKILPEIRKIYKGKVITAEHYDINRWKALDKHESFAGYDCIGLTMFPRREYDGVSDMKNIKDYEEYVETEAKIVDMLSKKYAVECKLAVPMGLDYWQGSHLKSPVPSASAVAKATDAGLAILKEHNFTGVFISHWASEPDHFGENKEVEIMLKKRWVKTK